MSWGIAETASEIEKIKSESADYLNGLNSCGVIDWNTYNYAFDFYENLLMKAYEQGEKDAQPDPCDDPRADVYYLAEKIGIHRLYALVVALRGEPEPCEDAVSREAVSEWLKQYGQDVLHGKYKFSLMYIWKNLTDLPSVQIKRKNGKWIYNSPVTMKCNQCGFVIKDWDWHRFKCCPNCGANMKGEQDD